MEGSHVSPQQLHAVFQCSSYCAPVFLLKIVVRVIDVNDQPPVFAKAVFTVNVSEFANVTSFILFLNASDKDMVGL